MNTKERIKLLEDNIDKLKKIKTTDKLKAEIKKMEMRIRKLKLEDEKYETEKTK